MSPKSIGFFIFLLMFSSNAFAGLSKVVKAAQRFLKLDRPPVIREGDYELICCHGE